MSHKCPVMQWQKANHYINEKIICYTLWLGVARCLASFLSASISSRMGDHPRF